MMDFFNWGVTLIDTLRDVGVYFFYTGSGIPGLEDVSIATVLFGGGLVVLLGYKIVKFVLDTFV